MTKVISSAKTETYRENLKMGIIKNKTMQVLSFIKDNPKCNTDHIRIGLNMPHQTATAIISNLLDEGIIKIIGETKVKNSTYSNYLFVEDYSEELKLKKARHLAKFENWMEHGLANFKDDMTNTFLTYLTSEHDYFKLTNK